MQQRPLQLQRGKADAMMTQMSDHELIRCFETDSLPGEFHHEDHVRLAFAYLCECAPLEALQRFCLALKGYAAARGKTQLYHETITHAYFFLIRERMARGGSHNWEEFSRNNPDLLVWRNGVLDRYYTESTLQSDLARSVFLFPDNCR
jgi:hypothetical protein